MGLFPRRRPDDPAAVAAAYRKAVGRFDALDELARECVDDVDDAAALNARYALTKVHETCFDQACASRLPRSSRRMADTVSPAYLLLGADDHDKVYGDLLADLAGQFGLDPVMLAEADTCRSSYEYVQFLRREVGDTAAQFDAGSTVYDDVDTLVSMAAEAHRKRADRGIGDSLYDAALAGLAAEVDALAGRAGRPGLPDPPS